MPQKKWELMQRWAIVIEDSVLGVQAGVAAGATVIGLLAGSHIQSGHEQRLREAGAHHIARSLPRPLTSRALYSHDRRVGAAVAWPLWQADSLICIFMVLRIAHSGAHKSDCRRHYSLAPAVDLSQARRLRARELRHHIIQVERAGFWRGGKS